VKINKAEIERLIDDIETKQEQLKPNVSFHTSIASAYKELGQYEAYDYCLALLRQVSE
jgi:hypothetical protein